MATGKRSTKPAVRRAARTPKATRSSKSVLDKMSPGELAEVLRALLKKHPDLKSEAAAIALEMVSSSYDDSRCLPSRHR